MIEALRAADEQLFLFFNQFHTPFFDELMYWLSDTKIWIPFYVILAVLTVWKYRWRSIYIFILIALTITFADQFTSSFMKPFFERLRPCHNPEFEGLIHLAKGCGGLYGFASSHAANTFGLAMLLFLVFKKHFKYSWLLFLWAGIVSYSRVYLAAHYPGDVIVGGVVGALGAWLLYFIYKKTVPAKQ